MFNSGSIAELERKHENFCVLNKINIESRISIKKNSCTLAIITYNLKSPKAT